MGIDLLRRTETLPETWPTTPAGLSEAAEALAPALIWGRLEAYCAWRGTEREIVYILEGFGAWRPDVFPVTVATVEVWSNDEWAATTLTASPEGGYMLDGGTYRVTTTAGAEAPVTVPPAIAESYGRIAEYMVAADDKPGSASFRLQLGGGLELETDRAPTWRARAIQNSGAGDLLRAYRRA